MSLGGSGEIVLGVRIDVTGANEASTQMQAFGKSVGTASSSLESMDTHVEKASVSLKKLSFAVFGASLSVINIIQASSRWDNAIISIDKKTIQLERTQINLRQQIDRLQKAYSSGTISQEQYNIALDKIGQTEESIKVKTRELENEQKQLNDTYITFVVSMASSLLFTFSALRESLKGVTLATTTAKLSTIYYSNAFKMLFFDVEKAKLALLIYRNSTLAAGSASLLSAVGVRALTKAMWGLMGALGPVGWAMLAITASLEIITYFSEDLKKLLGIETDAAKMARELAEAQRSAGDAFGEFNDIIEGSSSRFDGLFTKYGRTIDELARFRGALKDTGSTFQSTGGGIGQTSVGGIGAGTGTSLGTTSENGAVSGTFDGRQFMRIPQTPAEALQVADENARFEKAKNYTQNLRINSVLLKDAQMFVDDELALTNDLTEQRKIIISLQEIINLSYKDGNGLLTLEGQALDRIVNAESQRLKWKEKNLVAQKENNAALQQEINLQEELKKKQESLFKTGTLFLAGVKSASREIFETAKNRMRLFKELGEGKDDSIAGLISGTFNELTGYFSPQMNIMSSLQRLVGLYAESSDAVSAGNLPEYRRIQGIINRESRGQNLSGNIRSISEQMANNRVTMSSGVGRRVGVNTGQGGGGRTTARSRGGRRGRGSRGISGLNPTAYRSSIAGLMTYTDVFSEAELLKFIESDEDSYFRGRGSGVSSMIAEGERRREEILRAMKAEVRAGLESRISREQRFATHIGEFGATSVSAGGGTAMDWDTAIPFLQQMITTAMDTKTKSDLEQVISMVKNR